MFVEIFEVGAESERLGFPIGQAEQGADADAAESTGIRALRAIEPPVEILFRPGGVQCLIDGAIVRFLIDHESLRAVADDFGILIVLHRSHFDRQCGHEGFQDIEAFLQVSV